MTDAADDTESDVITEGLRAYNETQAGVLDSRALAILVRNLATRQTVGGLLGRTSLGLLRVDRFFLPEHYGATGLAAGFSRWQRKRGDGAVVLAPCCPPSIFRPPVSTRSRVVARIDCEPPGHTRFYMTKKLT